MRSITALSLGAALLAAGAPLAAPAQADDPAKLLRPYYEALRRETTLPVAPPGRQLAEATELTRIAFGSCTNETRSQAHWPVIAKTDPQLFVLIGDNVYGDIGWAGDAALASLRASYAALAGHAEFSAFRAQVPMLTTWDDHDLGLNDAGAAFAFREWSETIYENFWDSPAQVRDRPGVYHSAIIGPEGRRVQILLLDTRFFRSTLKRMAPGETPPPLGPYLPDESPGATLLGEDQWRWLEAELRKPADLRLVFSSIQMLSSSHNFESWSRIPRERERLFAALGARRGGGLLLLSGDRHSGALYSESPKGLGGEVWEVTSSSLNMPSTRRDLNTREPDPLRSGAKFGQANFGLLEIDWQQRVVAFGLRDMAGATLVQSQIAIPRGS